MSIPIDITDDTLASSLVPVQCASLAPPALFKKGRRQKKKKEVLHLSRCYTHTHTPGRAGKTLKGKRKKKAETHTHTHTHTGQCALPRGRMYAPGFRWRPWVSASFAWQAWDNVHCQGVGCTPRGSAGVPGSPPLLRGRRGTMCTAKGSDVRPGVPLASLGLRLFCVAGVGQCALSRGRMYASGSAGVPGSPPLLRGRRGAMCTVKGSDVRPGVPLASLGLRLFCVAGVGQCALPRGRMYAPGFRWRPWVSASFAWQAWDNVHSRTHALTHSLTHPLTHSFTHSLARSLAHSLTHSLTHSPDSLSHPSLTHTTLTSLTHTLTHSPVHAHTYTHTHTQTHPPSPLHHSYPSSSLLACLCSV